MASNRLKELRKEKGLTLDGIAELTGIKRGTYNNYENGKTEPKLATWIKLARFFNVDMGYLQGVNNYDKMPENYRSVHSSSQNNKNISYDFTNFKEGTSTSDIIESDLNNRLSLKAISLLETLYSEENPDRQAINETRDLVYYEIMVKQFSNTIIDLMNNNNDQSNDVLGMLSLLMDFITDHKEENTEQLLSNFLNFFDEHKKQV